MGSHMVFEIEIRIINPLWVSDVERHEGQSLSVARDQMQSGRHVIHERCERYFTLDDGYAGTVHGSTCGFCIQERSIVISQPHGILVAGWSLFISKLFQGSAVKRVLPLLLDRYYLSLRALLAADIMERNPCQGAIAPANMLRTNSSRWP